MSLSVYAAGEPEETLLALTEDMERMHPYAEFFSVLTQYVRTRLVISLGKIAASRYTGTESLQCSLTGVKLVGSYSAAESKDRAARRALHAPPGDPDTLKVTGAWDFANKTMFRGKRGHSVRGDIDLHNACAEIAGKFQKGFLQNLQSANMTIDKSKIRSVDDNTRSFKVRFSICSSLQMGVTFEVRALFSTAAKIKTISDLASWTNFTYSCKSPCSGVGLKVFENGDVYMKNAESWPNYLKEKAISLKETAQEKTSPIANHWAFPLVDSALDDVNDYVYNGEIVDDIKTAVFDYSQSERDTIRNNVMNNAAWALGASPDVVGTSDPYPYKPGRSG